MPIGSFNKPISGWADYNDASTTTTPIVLAPDVWTILSNDGAGTYTNKNFLPSGVTELLNVSTGALDFTQLLLGDILTVRLDFTITPGTNNQSAQIRYKLGTGAGAYTLNRTLPRLDAGSGQPYRFALATDMIYLGDANTKDNPGIIEVQTDGSSTITNAGLVIEVTRRK